MQKLKSTKEAMKIQNLHGFGYMRRTILHVAENQT
jgi:hypothetical protein